MEILTIIYSIILLFFFHPLYNNYTSLMSSHSLLYYLWVILLTVTLTINLAKIIKTKYLYLLSLIFLIGTIIPYNNKYYLGTFLHVFIPMICIITTLLLILYKIKNEPKAHLLFQWYTYGLSIISMLIIFFSQINGLIEITILIFIILMLNLLKN